MTSIRESDLLRSRRCTAATLLSALAVGFLLAACRPSAQLGGGVDPSGVYSLVSVDGKPLPADITHGDSGVHVQSGAFTIRADGTCESRTVFSADSGPEVVREVSATYTQEGSTLRMRWKGAGRTVGTVDGNTFTMDNEGTVFVYRR